MANIKHDVFLEWTNGKGETPVSTEYALTQTARDLIHPPGEPGRSIADLSLEDYEEWNRLDDKLGQLHLAGHVGKAIRYEEN